MELPNVEAWLVNVTFSVFVACNPPPVKLVESLSLPICVVSSLASISSNLVDNRLNP